MSGTTVFAYVLCFVSLFCFATYTIFAVIRLNMRVRQQRQRTDEQVQVTERNRQRKLQAWQERVKQEKHLLTGSDWRDPNGKEKFVLCLYGHSVPDYLWYSIGDAGINDKDNEKICKFFWPTNGQSFGDFELHYSGNPELKSVIRIRNAENFASEIEVSGQKCPLYQTGYSHFGDSEEGCVNFLRLFDKEPQAVS